MPLSPLYPSGGGTSPKNYSMFWGDGSVLTGNPVTLVVEGTQINNLLAYQLPAADGDSIKFDIIADAGNYTLNIMGKTSSSRGKTDIFIDNNLITTFDWYSGANANNIIKNVNITLAEGAHIIKSIINGKNAASSGYLMIGTRIYLTPL